MVRRRSSSLSVLVFSLAAGPLLGVEVPFAAKATIEGGLALATVAAAADFDGDGDLDVLGCSEGTASGVGWWENTAGDGSAWTGHPFDADFDCRQVVAADLDRDGDLDVVGAAAAVGGGGIGWWENDLEGSASWLEHGIDAAFDGAVTVAVGDLDGDGDLDVAGGRGGMVWWANDGTPADGGWTPHVVFKASGVDGIVIADVDADGRLDLATAGGASPPAFGAHIVTGSFGDSHQIAAGDVNGDGRLDLVATSEGDGEIAWFDRIGPDPDDWTEHPIAGSVPVSQWTRTTDLDGDGDLDVLGTSRADGEVSWFENLNGDGLGWSEHVLLAGWSDARSVEAADLDGDGDLDVLAASIGVGEIAWWRNRTLHRSAVYPAGLDVGGPLNFATDVAAGDLDGDGDLDLVATNLFNGVIRWSENDGTPGDGGWTDYTLASGLATPIGVTIADLDGDGDPDVAVCVNQLGSVLWFENDGTPGGGEWVPHGVASGFSAGNLVTAGDLDGDGDFDLVASQDSGVSWFENDGTPADGEWTVHPLVPALLTAFGLAIADGDGDGDLDVFATGSIPALVLWAESDGTPGDGGWTLHTLSSDFGGAAGLALCDLDGDGDLDLAAAASNDNAVAWFENDGTPGDGGWVERPIAAGFSQAVGAACGDFDADGDADVAAVGNARVAVWLSDGSPADGGWQRIDLASAFSDAFAVLAADLDRDGKPDVVATGREADRVRWWRGDGGHLALPTADAVAASNPIEGAGDVLLLGIEGIHRGRPGDADAELATLALLFEEAAGQPLASGELDALVAALRLYLDDGDGLFEPGGDDAGILSAGAPFSLTGGRLAVGLTDGDPGLQLAFGTGRSWWLAADLAATAGSAKPNTLRVTHLTGSSAGVTSSGEMADTDLPLALEPGPDVASTPLIVRTMLIFADGFESGDTSAWSLIAP